MLFGARRLIEGQRIPGICYWGGFPSGKKKKGPSAGSFAGGGNPYYQNPDGSAKSEADQRATYDTVASSYSPSGSYTGPANTTVYKKEPSASAKLKAYRKEAEKIVDSKVEFDTYDGLPKLKSAAASVARASGKANVGKKASGSGKAKVAKGDPALRTNSTTGLSPKKQNEAFRAMNRKRNIPKSERKTPEQRASSILNKTYKEVVPGQEASPRRILSGREVSSTGLQFDSTPNKTPRSVKEQVAIAASRTDWKEAMKDDLSVTTGVRSPWGADPDKIASKATKQSKKADAAYKDFQGYLDENGYLLPGADKAEAMKAYSEAQKLAKRTNTTIGKMKAASKLEQEVLDAILKQPGGRERLFPSAQQQRTDAIDRADLMGHLLPDTPIEQALMVGGAVSAIRGGAAVVRGAQAVNAAKVPLEAAKVSFPTVRAGKHVFDATKVGKVVNKVRKPIQNASTAGTVGAVAAAQATGNLEPNAKAILDSAKGQSLSTTARGLYGIPAAVIGGASNLALTADRALEAPFMDDPKKKSLAYIEAPAREWAKANLDEAVKMFKVLTSKDSDEIRKAIEDDYGYLPYVSLANLLRAPNAHVTRAVKTPVVKAAREAFDSARTMKTTRTKLRVREPRAPGTPAPPIFPKLAAKKHLRDIDRRVARESSRRIASYNVGGRDLEWSAKMFNGNKGGRQVNSILDDLQKEIAARDGERNLPLTGADLSAYLGGEARFSTRSVSEVRDQVKLRKEQLDAEGAPKNTVERYQIEAVERLLEQAPHILVRPRDYSKAELRAMSPDERAKVKTAKRFWAISDAYRVAALNTPGLLRSDNPLEVADAEAVRTLNPESTLEAPAFTLDKKKETEQLSINEARKENRTGQRHTKTIEKRLAVQRQLVKDARRAEAKRLKDNPKLEPSKRLANAEAKLARMEADLEAHKTNLSESIYLTKQRQNKLNGALTKAERQAVFDSLPANASAGRKRAAFAAARTEKLKALDAEAIYPIRKQFDAAMEAAMKKYGIQRSTFIANSNQMSREGIESAGTFDRVATRKDLRRSGEMRRQGEAIHDFKAMVDTIQGAALRESQARLANALIEDSAFITKLPDGDKKLYTKREAFDLMKSGKIRRGDYVFVRSGMLDNEEQLAKILDSDANDPVGALKSEAFDSEFMNAEKFDAEGQGGRGYLIKALDVDRTLETMKSLGRILSTMSKINGYGSRAVLHTSFAWMMAQPVAEMMVLLMHDHNPARLARAVKLVKDAHGDPDLARSFAFSSDSAISSRSIGSDSKSYQGSTHDAMRVTKQGPVGAIAHSMYTLDAPAYIDRVKGGWIRKVGFAMEVDRELNSAVRMAMKGIWGTMDEIDKVSGKLRTMNRRDQIVWLDSKEGRLAAEKLQNNLDDMLGNWTALSPREKAISQFVFFYPFMRFSLDWTLRTFPKRHPIRYAAFTSAAQWNAEQVEEIFSGKPSFFQQWASAPIYGGEDGRASAIVPFGRATPGGNVLTELFGDATSLSELSKAFSPAIGIPFRAIFNYDSFGKPKKEDIYSQEKPKTLADSALAVFPNLLEQGIGTSFPTRYLDRAGAFGDKRDPQPGDEKPTKLPFGINLPGIGNKVDSYGLRSGIFPFLPQDTQSLRTSGDVSNAYDRRFEAFYKENAGGDRFSELNDKFEKMGLLGAPEVGSPLRKEYIEWNELRKQRKEGTKEIAKQEEILRGLYKQEGIPIPDTLQVEARTGELVGGTLSKKDRLELNRALGAGPGARASIMRGRGEVGNDGLATWVALAGEKPTPKYAPLKRKQKVSLANQILDTKEKMVGGIKLPDKSEQTFVNTIAAETGLSPRMIAAWTRQENGNAFGDWNRLNIGQTDSGPVGPANEADKWTDPKTAGHWTAEFIKGNFGGADQRIVDGLAAAVGKPDMEQIDLLDATPWAGDPAYGEHLRGTYADVANAPVLKPNPRIEKKFERLVRRGKAAGLYDAPKQTKQVKGKLPGPYDGARTMARKIIGASVRGDKEYGHSASGDHTPGNPGYAQDINSIPGTMEAEREPPYTQETLDKIVANLQKMGSAIPTGMKIGENWDTNEIVGGYRIQLLTNEGGVVNHIHVGVRYEGDGSESVPMPSNESLMAQVKAQRYGTADATGSTSQTAGSTTTTAFPTTSSPAGTTSDPQAPYNQRMNKWQKLMAFRADPTGTTGATSGTASDSTLPDLSAAEQIANLPSAKRKKSYIGQ